MNVAHPFSSIDDNSTETAMAEAVANMARVTPKWASLSLNQHLNSLGSVKANVMITIPSDASDSASKVVSEVVNTLPAKFATMANDRFKALSSAQANAINSVAIVSQGQQIIMNVADPDAFINDKSTRRAMIEAVANIAGVTPGWVSLILNRHLNSLGGVKVNFMITIPSHASDTASKVQSDIANGLPAKFETIAKERLTALDRAQANSIESVENIESAENIIFQMQPGANEEPALPNTVP